MKTTFFKVNITENLVRVIGSVLYGFLKAKLLSRYTITTLCESRYVMLDFMCNSAVRLALELRNS